MRKLHTTIVPVRPRHGVAKSGDALFVLATALMIVALAGCGGGKTAAPPTPMTIALPVGSVLPPGTIRAGQSQTVQDAGGTRTVVACPAGGPDCVVTVGPDGPPQSTGGTPRVVTYTAIEGLPSGHTLMAGTIPAGESRTVRDADGTRTVVTCPAGGEACVVSLTPSGGAESTGGRPRVATYTAIEGLPSGHTLMAGAIPAGESRTVRDADGTRTVVTCPAGGEDCMVILTPGGGAESTGGAPTVATIPYTAIEGLPEGHTLMAGAIPAGESRTVHDANGRRTVVTCPAGGEACMVTLTAGGGAESTGGTLRVETFSYRAIEGLPSGHTLMAGTIPAGGSRTVHDANGRRTVLTCPAGGEACVVSLTEDGGAESTGGTPTVATFSYRAIEGLPSGHTLMAGTIPAGESRTVRDAGGTRTVVTCPAGGEACVVSLTPGGGAESTGGTPTVARYTTIELPEGHTLTARTIPAGESLMVHEAEGTRMLVTCPAGGEDCVVTLTPGGAESIGGALVVETVPHTAMASTSVELPEGHTLMAGTIPAGESRTVHEADGARTVVTCPAGGEACVVTLTAGGAESTGGALTVATYTAIAGLPDDHTLTEGTIPAGESRAIGGYSKGRSYRLVCPFEGEDCVLTIREFDFVSTGGTPYVDVATSNEMVWQANNGPDPANPSNGGHARGLQGRLLQANVDTLNVLLRSDVGGRVKRAGAIVQNSKNFLGEPSRTVTPTASWASSDAAPTLALEVASTGGVGSRDGVTFGSDFSVDEDSDIPSLGTGWNGVALGRTMNSPFTGEHAVHAVLYSNIEQQPEGGSADEYYLTLGAWLVLPKDPNASSALNFWQYNLGVFAQGHAATALTNSDLQALSGTATYEGPATGLYSKATYHGSLALRRLRSAEVGSFTATATINANFGGAGNFTGAEFGGSVTNFRENGESLGDWTVDLNAGLTAMNEPASEPMTDDLFYGGTGGSADGESLSGQWGVQFFRNQSGGSADYAVGTFTASTDGSNNDALHIVGAYGAESQ